MGPDPEVTAISHSIRDKLVEPWLVGLQQLTGVDESDAAALADTMLAGAGEIIQRWIDGEFSREKVASLLGRVILAVLHEFTD